MNIHDYAERRGISLKQILDFTRGVNPLGPSNRAKHAIREQIKYVEYYPDHDMRYLKRYLCRKEQIGESDIVFGPGSTHLLKLLMGSVRPRTVLLVSPELMMFREVANMCGAETIIFPLHEEAGFSLDTEKFVCAMGHADMAILSSVNGMTGTATPREDLLRIMGEADRLGITLVIDESYGEYTNALSLARDAVESRSTLILRSFSLFHALYGLRLAYGIGASRPVSTIGLSRPSFQVTSLAPRAALMSLKDGAYRTRTLRFIEEEKQYLKEKLSRVDGVETVDTPCNLILLKIAAPLEELKEALSRYNILIDGFSSARGEVYLRLPIGSHKANASFLRVLRKIVSSRRKNG
jgi:threonine-phosphate decarboxylase